MNRVTLIGFLGADAETKSTNGGDLAILSLATKDVVEERRRRMGIPNRMAPLRCLLWHGRAAAA